jgi:hypothetical protein
MPVVTTEAIMVRSPVPPEHNGNTHAQYSTVALVNVLNRRSSSPNAPPLQARWRGLLGIGLESFHHFNSAAGILRIDERWG